MNKVLKSCPVCNSNLEITEYHCNSCNTTIKGNFAIDDIASLNSTQQEFVKTFLCCQGSIKEVEKALNISYPTVKNRLQEITSIICSSKSKKNNLSILEKVDNGEITVQQAINKLKGR
ncbi:MAG: DUF2089 domain-containing protein [Candidatus Cloacimonadota bacterium]|nr:DUF2089 domain-containing protein [Candidatus Cloacimonadota bacterium]